MKVPGVMEALVAQVLDAQVLDGTGGHQALADQFHQAAVAGDQFRPAAVVATVLGGGDEPLRQTGEDTLEFGP